MNSSIAARLTVCTALTGFVAATVAQPARSPQPPGPTGPMIVDAPMLVHEFGPGRFVELLRPDFLRRDARLLTTHLDLDSSQKAITEALLQDYVDSFDAAAEELRAIVKRALPPMPQMAMQLGAPDGIVGDLRHALGDHIAIPAADGTEDEGVTIWEGDDGSRQVRIIARGGPGDGPPPMPMMPPDPDGAGESPGQTTVSKSVEVRAQPGGEPQVSIRMVAKGPDGESLIPPEVREKIVRQLQERIQQRIKEQMARRALEEVGRTKDEPPPPTDDGVASVARQFMAAKQQLREQLVSDLQMLLTPTQLTFWDATMQALRRQQSIHRSRLSGEYIDLRQVFDRSAKSAIDPATLDQLLREYEQHLDQALTARDSFLQNSEIDAFLATRQRDMDKRLELARQEQAFRLAVRTTNESGAHALEQAIADDAQRESLRQAVREASYRRIYQPTRTQRALQDALALDDLSPQASQAIVGLRESYESELAIANEQLMQATRRHEPDQHVRMLEFMARLRAGEADSIRPPQEPVAHAYAERSRIGYRYLEQLRSQLTPDQLAKVPAAKPPTFEMPGYGGAVMRFHSTDNSK